MYGRGVFEVSGLVCTEGNTRDRDNLTEKLVFCPLKYSGETDISEENKGIVGRLESSA